jgi:hypothetical protein
MLLEDSKLAVWIDLSFQRDQMMTAQIREPISCPHPSSAIVQFHRWTHSTQSKHQAQSGMSQVTSSSLLRVFERSARPDELGSKIAQGIALVKGVLDDYG